MQDRPTYDELLAAVERFLDADVVPNSEGARRFHARVAANVIRILRRELQREEEALAAEWTGLNGLLAAADPPAGRAALRRAIRDRNAQLCERIRSGEADTGAYREQALDHVRRTVQEKLRVSDPEWLGRSQGAP